MQNLDESNNGEKQMLTNNFEILNTLTPSVQETRTRFFELLEHHKLSNSMINDVKQYLQFRDNESVDSKLMGEYFPWILKDVANLDSEKFNDIAVNWLAVYSSISMIDDKLDGKDFGENVNLTNSVADRIVSQLGTINLFKIVVGTKYEQLFMDSLVFAANGQESDVTLQRSQNKKEKEKSAVDKNRLLIGLSGAISATLIDNPEKADFILDFSRKVLVTLQHLDDISDYSEDLKMQNFTYLLSGIDTTKDLSTDSQILEELLDSNSLKNTLDKIIQANNETIELFESGMSFINPEKESIKVFYGLQQKLNDIIEFINLWRNIDVSDKDSYIDELKSRLNGIALGS